MTGTAPPATVSGPHGLAAHAGSFTPGSTVIVDGRVNRVLGRIIAVDHVETWLECLLDQDGERRWLAVEAPTGVVRYTVWQRDTAELAGFCPDEATLHATPLSTTEQGAATYSASGRFDPFVIPDAGFLDFVEFTYRGGRVAAARFHTAQPWLVGVGTGEPVTVSFA
jgi:hypothetical protein